MKYTILKELDGFKEGQVVSYSELITPDRSDEEGGKIIAQLINDGIIDPVFDDGVYEDHIVTDQDLIDNPDWEKNGIKVGDTMSVRAKDEAPANAATASADVDVEKDEPIDEDEAGTFAPDPDMLADAPTLASLEAEEVEPVVTYKGQEVISQNEREVEGRVYSHLKVADGSEYDLTPEEVEADVITK